MAIPDATQAERFRPVLLLALREIGARSGGDLPPERELGVIVQELADPRLFALWIAVDRDRLSAGFKANEAVCGVMTLELREDAGTRVAYITRGWTRSGYEGAPFDLGLPLAVRWARARGCSKLRTMTERSSAAAAGERFDVRRLRARLKGLLAYARWIYRRGFVMRVTVFEMDLTRVRAER